MSTRMFVRLFPALIMAVCLCVPLARTAELWVSPNGDDGNPGSKEKPLKSFGAALRAVAKHPQRGKEPLTVRFMAGTYYLPATVVFVAADSGTKDAPITYAAADGADVVVSGGQRVDLEWTPYKDGILQARVSEDFTSDQLFVNGVRQHMARFPNYDPSAQYFQGFSADATSPERTKNWKDPRGGFVHAMHRSLWGDMHWRITGKSANGTLELEGGWQNNRQMGAHKKFRFVENIFEELDAPGEWFLDRQKKVLYFYPPKDVKLAGAVVEVVRLPHLLEFRGSEKEPVRFIHLQGLKLTHAARVFMDNKEPLLRSDWTTYRGGAVFFNGAEDCGVRDCFIDQVGGNAVFANKYNRRISVVGCRIVNAGANGVSFVGNPEALRSPLFEYHQTQTLDAMDKTPGPKRPDYPAECLVEDCLICRNGRVEKQTAGVNICMAESITVRHCSIYDCPRAGINICDGAFGGHLIEGNDVFDTVKETGDHGSFNSWGRDRFWHKSRAETEKWVKQHPEMPKWDCHKTIVIRNNRWRCDHGWDIDLDDGSSNYELYNNVCLAGGIKLREGYYRTVYNNVLVDYSFCPHVWYSNCHTLFQRNIIWQDQYHPAGMRKTDQTAGLDFNLVHQPGGQTRPATGLQKFGADKNSLIADAQFIDPITGDYRVKHGSPALKLGFKDFPMNEFGVRKPALKKLALSSPLPGTLAAAAIRSGGWGRKYSAPTTANWLGAKIKAIQDQNEMSAVGLGDKNGVLVVSVPAGSRAATAGLKENDVIRGVNDRAVKSLTEFAEVYKRDKKAGPVVLKLWRDQAETTLKVE